MSSANSQCIKKNKQLHKQRIYISSTHLKLPLDHNSDNESVTAGQVLSEIHHFIHYVMIFYTGGESSQCRFLYFLPNETQHTNSRLVSTTITPKEFGLV